MNTAALKTFGQKARNVLMDGVARKLHYWGFDNKGNVTEEPMPLAGGYMFREQVFDDPMVPVLWQRLKESIAADGITEVTEKAAYVWFNRLMALQILSKNGYEQPVLDPVSAEEQTPAIVKRARQAQYSFLNKAEQTRLQKILTDYEKETQVFAILITGFCHHHSLLNTIFGGIDDYTELLLPDDILSSGGFLDLLHNGGYITEEDYRAVELIGWLYQFYISEKKDDVFKKFKEGKKAEAKDIPAATQIFTPNWIVKYMVENTVGKIWLDLKPNSPIRAEMLYLVETENETPAEPIIAQPEDLKLLDPAAGSGHILVEGFDLLMKMYLEEFAMLNQAVESILEHNLFGLDIDIRAAQLAQFAVLMKAAKYDAGILQKNIVPRIYAMPEPVYFTKEDVTTFLGEAGAAYIKPLQDALHLMLQAQNLGSIMQFNISDAARTYILQQLKHWQKSTDLDLLQKELLLKLTPYLKVIEVLSQQYEAIAANPPYMGQRNMNSILRNQVLSNYELSKNDLAAVFMEVCYSLITEGGNYAMINQQSWMFLGTFEKLRSNVVSTQKISSMVHLGARTFDELSGEVVQNTLFVISKGIPRNDFSGVYYRLVDFKSSGQKHQAFLRKLNEYRNVNQSHFSKIPGTPIAYWASSRTMELYEVGKLLGLEASSSNGIQTGDNDKYVRFWWEIDFSKKQKKWINYNKGGEYKKWYGNNYYVVNWDNNGAEIKSAQNSCIRGEEFYFREGVTWSDLTSGNLSARYFDKGYLFDASGPSAFTKGNISNYTIAGILNSNYINELAKILNPTLHFQSGNFRSIPFVETGRFIDIDRLVKANVEIAKQDWDMRELSDAYMTNPLFAALGHDVKKSLSNWTQQVSQQLFLLHQNEEEINFIVNSIYGVQDQVGYQVPITEITILTEELILDSIKNWSRPFPSILPIKEDEVIQQLISYSIGCFVGRFRLDKPSLQIAHPNPSLEELRPYSYTSPVTEETRQFVIDEDAIIPLMGSKGNFVDDANNRIRQFLQIIWGEETLTHNINFIQDCLQQDIEDYLVKKFWAFHVRMYSKKPIYWLFSSKKGAFQALVYMHRMNRFTVEKLRDKYLLKHIQYLEQEVARMEVNMAAMTRVDQKKLDQLRKDLQECNDYDLLLKDVATKQIEFDLDDGVTRNYELFKGVVAPIK